MCQKLTCDPHGHQHSLNQNTLPDEDWSPWDTIILVLVCELSIEEYASQPYGVIPSVLLKMSTHANTKHYIWPRCT